MLILFLRGDTYTICRTVIVPGTTIGSGGGISPIPPGNLSTGYNHLIELYHLNIGKVDILIGATV